MKSLMVTETIGEPQGVAPGGAASQLPHLQLLPSVSKKKEASVSTYSQWTQPALQTPDNTELGKSNARVTPTWEVSQILRQMCQHSERCGRAFKVDLTLSSS